MPHFVHSGFLILAVIATAIAADGVPMFKITTKRDSDRVEVKAEMGRVILSVHSPFGISNAVVERKGERWPDVVVLRLYLQGLESFRVTNDKVKLELSVSSGDGKVRLWMDGREDAPPDAESPFWMEVGMVGMDGKPVKGIPLQDGYIELRLPQAFFDGNPRSIALHWIDFYRN